jgi:hypothetical protein
MSPVQFKDQAGKPYRPSNGTEGEIFMEKWCERCMLDTEDNPCEILTCALCFDIDESDYPKEWRYDYAGRPMCTAFVEKP